MKSLDQPRRSPRTARELALQVLVAVEEGRAYANLALNQALSKGSWSKADRALATELVYGSLRQRGALDWALKAMMEKGLGRLSPWIRNLLRLGAYQILYMERIPAAAATHEAVELAKVYGHAGTTSLVNGVLRNLIRQGKEIPFPSLETDPLHHLAAAYSHPTWMVARWLKRYGVEGTLNLCRANNEPAPVFLRCNTLRIDREGLLRRLAAEGVEAEASRRLPEGIRIRQFSSVGELDSYREGLFQVQDEASMLVSRVLAPCPDSLVLDVCSAPGGKTTHLAQLMENRGKIYAFDLHPHKVKLVQEACSRLGITIVEVAAADARHLPKELEGKADYILVDAPCSGLGVLRRRADARWRKEAEDGAGLAALQKEILNSAAACLRPGGVLVYSTCTIEPEENFEVIKDFLKSHPHFTGEDLTPFLPFPVERPEDLRQISKGYIQFLPHIHEMDGFFIARLRRGEV